MTMRKIATFNATMYNAERNTKANLDMNMDLPIKNRTSIIVRFKLKKSPDINSGLYLYGSIMFKAASTALL